MSTPQIIIMIIIIIVVIIGHLFSSTLSMLLWNLKLAGSTMGGGCQSHQENKHKSSEFMWPLINLTVEPPLSVPPALLFWKLTLQPEEKKNYKLQWKFIIRSHLASQTPVSPWGGGGVSVVSSYLCAYLALKGDINDRAECKQQQQTPNRWLRELAGRETEATWCDNHHPAKYS